MQLPVLPNQYRHSSLLGALQNSTLYYNLRKAGASFNESVQCSRVQLVDSIEALTLIICSDHRMFTPLDP